MKHKMKVLIEFQASHRADELQFDLVTTPEDNIILDWYEQNETAETEEEQEIAINRAWKYEFDRYYLTTLEELIRFKKFVMSIDTEIKAAYLIYANLTYSADRLDDVISNYHKVIPGRFVVQAASRKDFFLSMPAEIINTISIDSFRLCIKNRIRFFHFVIKNKEAFMGVVEDVLKDTDYYFIEDLYDVIDGDDITEYEYNAAAENIFLENIDLVKDRLANGPYNQFSHDVTDSIIDAAIAEYIKKLGEQDSNDVDRMFRNIPLMILHEVIDVIDMVNEFKDAIDSLEDVIVPLIEDDDGSGDKTTRTYFLYKK